MTNRDLKLQFGYLVFPYNEEIKNIFLKEKNVTKYIISKKGKKDTSPQSLSENFRIQLEELGYLVTPFRETRLCGIKDIGGSIIDVTKLVSDGLDGKEGERDIERGEIKALQIRFSGIDDKDLNEKMRAIKDFLKSRYNIDSDNTFNFMYSRTDICDKGDF